MQTRWYQGRVLTFWTKRKEVASKPCEMSTQERLEASCFAIEDADAGIRNAELAISEYLSTHANAHAIHGTSHGWVVRLDAMHADLVLTGLERIRDEARERFARALDTYAKLKKREDQYVSGIKQI